MNSNNRVKIAIVGCGAVTKSLHLPAALRSPNAELAALVDTNRKQAELMLHKFSLNCPIYDHLEEIIDGIDGVIIATPNHTHYPLAKIVLNKGIPVLIEKPITTRYKDAVELCKLAERKNTFISVGYKTRHYPSVIKLKELLDRRFFGKINYFHYEFGSKGGWQPVSGYNVHREMAGGGVLMVTGTHFIDRMLYWFGEPEDFEFQDDSYGGVEANCKAKMIFNNGTESFTGTFFMSKTIKLKNKFFLDTENYFCELGESQTESITLFPKDHLDIKFDVSSSIDEIDFKNQNYIQKQFEEFVANILKKGNVTVDGWFAARSIKLIEEMYKRKIQLNEPWLIFD